MCNNYGKTLMSGAVAQLVEGLLSMHQARFCLLHCIKLDMMAQACNPGTLEVVAKEPTFKVILCYTLSSEPP